MKFFVAKGARKLWFSFLVWVADSPISVWFGFYSSFLKMIGKVFLELKYISITMTEFYIKKI